MKTSESKEKSKQRHLYLVGLSTVQDSNLLFDQNKPFSGCLICGAVYQTSDDRNAHGIEEFIEAVKRRKLWSQNHARRHTTVEHRQLALSGSWCTPQAAKEFAGFGIIALSDMVMCDEHENALMESKPIPDKEVLDVL